MHKIAINKQTNTHAKRPLPKKGGCKMAAGKALEIKKIIQFMKATMYSFNAMNSLIELNLEEQYALTIEG